MTMKKKILLVTVAAYMISGTAAYSQLDVQLNLGQPPAYVAVPPPAPAYVSPYPTYYDPWHRHHDREYWRAHRAPPHDEHRDHEHR